MCQIARQYDLEACALVAANGFRDEIVMILEKQARREEKG
jgi:hypothetical protein